MLATAMAWLWLPETVHRGSAVGVSPWRALPDVLGRRHLRPLLIADFAYWCTVRRMHDDVCAVCIAAFRIRRRAKRVMCWRRSGCLG